MEAVPWAEALQIAGWLHTVLGQVQVASKARRGFLTWIAANAVLIVLCVCAGLWNARMDSRAGRWVRCANTTRTLSITTPRSSQNRPSAIRGGGARTAWPSSRTAAGNPPAPAAHC